MSTYLIRVTSTHPFLGTACQEVTVESDDPLLAAITGLEQLAIRSLDGVIGIELSTVQHQDPLRKTSSKRTEAAQTGRGEAIYGYHYHD